MRPTYRYPPEPTLDVEMLRACPFCGRQPVAGTVIGYPKPLVRCSYHTVWLQPEDWNFRSDAPAVMRPARPILAAKGDDDK